MRSVGELLDDTPAVRWFRNTPLAADLVLGVILGGLAVIIALSLDENFDSVWVVAPDSPVDWLLVIGSAWAIPFRRVAPVAAILGGSVIQVVVWSTALPDTFISTVVLLYSAAVHGTLPARRSAWFVAGGLIIYTAIGVSLGEAPLYALPTVALFAVASVTLGLAAAGRQSDAEHAEARAEELQRSRERERDRALVEERARIARELHDVVAHGLSVIVVQASAASRILDRDPEGAASALQQIEKTGRTALNEMRHVLSAIRTDPSESWHPAPGLAALDELVAELASTGLRVSVNDTTTLTGTGTRTAGTDNGSMDHNTMVTEPLPATVDVTAYRIVQESLTNVLKHGGLGAKASVDITRTERSLDLRIVDNGRGARPSARSGGAVDGDGQGLRGMQERVEVFGGRFAAGPHQGGGFAVAVSLPLDGTGSTK